jgi:hypothetical protein
MVFLNGDNDLEEEMIDDFLELSKVGSSRTVHIVAQLDRGPGFSTGFGDWENAYRFYVTRGMKPYPRCAIQDLGEANMGDGAELARFVTWAKTKYPAKRYCLVIADHGRGWMNVARAKLNRPLRVPADRPQQPGREMREFSARTPDEPPLDEFTPGATRSISTDYTSGGDKLYCREIADALAPIVGQQHLDVLGLDACLMAMVENSYAFRNIADILIASEDLEPASGWAHWRWLERLVQTPKAAPETLAEWIVTAYSSEYGTKSYHTLSAARLDRASALAIAISELANELTADLDRELDQIKIARTACFGYHETDLRLHGIDLRYFCEQLLAYAKHPALIRAANNLIAAFDLMMIANTAKPEQPPHRGYGSRGLAIYFPRSAYDFCWDHDAPGYLEQNQKYPFCFSRGPDEPDIATQYPLEFVEDHSWDNFLQEYFKRVLN